jgi:putative membrane protein
MVPLEKHLLLPCRSTCCHDGNFIPEAASKFRIREESEGKHLQKEEIPKMKTYLKLALMLIAGSLVACLGNGQFSPQGPGGRMPMTHYGFGYGGGILMGVILLVVIGALIYFFMQTQKTKGQTPTRNENHLDILKKRYAKGEIAKEDYERMKKDLEG